MHIMYVCMYHNVRDYCIYNALFSWIAQLICFNAEGSIFGAKVLRLVNIYEKRKNEAPRKQSTILYMHTVYVLK